MVVTTHSVWLNAGYARLPVRTGTGVVSASVPLQRKEPLPCGFGSCATYYSLPVATIYIEEFPIRMVVISASSRLPCPLISMFNAKLPVSLLTLIISKRLPSVSFGLRCNFKVVGTDSTKSSPFLFSLLGCYPMSAALLKGQRAYTVHAVTRALRDCIIF